MSTSQVSAVLEPASSLEPQPPMPPSTRRHWLLVLLFTAMLVAYVHRGTISVAVASSSMSDELQLSKTGVGVLLSAFFWVYSFMQVPSGWLVDRFGVRRAYSLGFLFWSLTCAVTGLARGFVSLLGFRIATGAGQAISFPATSRAVADWFPHKERGTVTAIYLTGVRLGAASINWIGGLYFAAKGNWKVFFLITGLLPLLWLLPWTKLVRKLEAESVSITGRKEPANRNASFLKSLTLLK